MKKVSIPRDGIGIVDISIYPEKSLKIFSQFRILNKLLAPTFFNSLRTDQQVGYVVSSYESRIREYPAISMVIISDNTDCLLYTSPSPRDVEEARMPSSA